MDLKITDNEFLRQYECKINGELAIIEYSQQDRKIFLTKVDMSSQLKDEGYLEPFIENVLQIIKEKDIKVMPTNPTIAGYMRKNRRKYKDLLPIGINL